ncbi:MAG: hypothetical protein G01um101418_609 [Parcubacteria group bacterium Gr01-1014_18]|nr:MAG: hypothetical protein Greene041636_100 [Parcubacteria group bacterium Greene0416_36]TSC80861.1 MAG: hypothetical protein G01um101418_609 [Parcubacteria group bacterium Gr01-1014_18]TSC99522.1 MAG: hypothetical protein Greene101420_189 [Parcubacteria group bacterium Greene1014_20]TSD07559.1 MAG: hypothetical protein Greene07142_16 [Parcubacteria group bacterium Greene0714_2]
MTGQGMLESLIAISVITVGVLAVMAWVVSNVSASNSSALRIGAASLSWEGIEAVRELRDSAYLRGAAWDTDIAGADNTAILVFDEAGNNFSFDFGVNALDEAGAILWRKGRLFLQSSSQPVGSVATPYRRLIRIENISANEKKVLSEVQWIDRGKPSSIISEERLFDWR